MRVLDACEHELLNWEVMQILSEERNRLEEDRVVLASPPSPGSSDGGSPRVAAVEPIEEEEPSHDKLRMDNLFTKLTSYLVDELHTNRLREERIPKALSLLNSHGLPQQCSCELLNNTRLCANSDVYVYTAIESVPNVNEETLEAAHNVVKYVLGSDEVNEEDMVGPLGLSEDKDVEEEEHPVKRPRRTSNRGGG